MILPAILLLALVLRTVALGSDLWIDEVAALTEFARYSWGQLVLSYDLANNHLLNSVLIKLAVRLFGEAEWSVRLPAVLFGVGGVWAQARLGATVASPREAWGTALLLAVSYHHIFFSQNARGYAALLFWSTLATTVLIRLREAPTRRGVFAYVASILLALLSHAVGIVVLAGHAVAFLGFRHGGTRVRLRPPVPLGCWALGAAAGVAVFLSAPVLLQALAYLAGDERATTGSPGAPGGGVHGMSYLATAGRSALGYHALGPFLLALAAGLPRAPLVWLPLAAAMPLGLLGLAGYRRQSPFLTALWIAPPAAMVAIVLTLGLGVYPRFFIFVLPALLLVLVRGTEEVARLARERLGRTIPALPWGRVPAGLLVGGALVSLAFLPGYYRYPKQDFRGALDYVRARQAPDEPVATTGLAAVGYRYYAPDIPVVREASDIDRLCGTCRALWVIYTFPEDLRARAPALFADLGRRFTIVQTFRGTVGDGAMVVARMERGDRG